MKKVTTVVAVVFCAAFFSAAAFAFDIPTSTGALTDTGAKIGLQTALNKKLDANKCAFKAGTADTTCDLAKVSKELIAAYNGIKQATKFNVYVNVKADNTVPAGKGKKSTTAMSGYDRAKVVSGKLQGNIATAALTDWWHYNSASTNNKGDNLMISVEVK